MGGRILLIPFFCVHYGMFTLVHGVFVVGLFEGGFKHGAPFPNFDTARQTFSEYDLNWAVPGFTISCGISFAANYLGGGEYRRTSLQQLMQQPYGRIVVLRLTILGSGFLTLALHSPAVGLLLLVALKIALDLRGRFA